MRIAAGLASAIVALGSLLPASAQAQAQTWPSHNIRVIVPFPAGGVTDVGARIVSQKKAREIWFLCRQYDAQQALDMGLVNTVVPLEELEAETVKWCREMPSRCASGTLMPRVGRSHSQTAASTCSTSVMCGTSKRRRRKQTC